MSDNLQGGDELFETLERKADEGEAARAPSRLKARVLSALLRAQEMSGRLRSLEETRSQGYGLCVFEDLWQRATSSEGAQRFNCCRICHARVLAEQLERAPIYWKNCPYAALGKK